MNEIVNPARELLERIGYSYVPRETLASERDRDRDALLTRRLTAALLRLNDWMTEEYADQAIFKLKASGSSGLELNRAIHEYLAYGMPLTIEPDGRQETPTVRFFDFDHPEPGAGLNDYVVTTQSPVPVSSERGSTTEADELAVQPDLVLFVNGIPLVVMEAALPTAGDAWKSEAVRQLRRYQEAGPEWRGAGAPALFATNLLCVAHSGTDAAFGAPGATVNAYAAWNSIDPLTDAEFERRYGVPAQGQARLIGGLLRPSVLLDILRDFVFFEPEGGRLVKKLPRHQQYRAVTNAAKRVLDTGPPAERGGVVSHAHGSGKSLTMVWLAQKLSRSPSLRNPTIVFVTDRARLDQLMARTQLVAPGLLPERAVTPRRLNALLQTNTGLTIMTTIQKLERVLDAPAGAIERLNDAANLIVIADEAHRFEYESFADRMRDALPNATCIGFTGTPIEKNRERSAALVFGNVIDSYTIRQSAADGATVPIYHEARLPRLHIEGHETLDQLHDALFGDEPTETQRALARRYANKEPLAESTERIEAIAHDIAEHFNTRIQPHGFKALVVAPSRRAALRYAEHLVISGLSAYPIITTRRDDGPEFRYAGELNDDEVISSFKKPDGDAQVLVVDRLLTDFTVPTGQALYLDRSMREHALLQAIALVNRPHSRTVDGVTTEKQYGLVIDYHGTLRDLAAALAIFDDGDVEEVLRELPEDLSAAALAR